MQHGGHRTLRKQSTSAASTETITTSMAGMNSRQRQHQYAAKRQQCAGFWNRIEEAAGIGDAELIQVIHDQFQRGIVHADIATITSVEVAHCTGQRAEAGLVVEVEVDQRVVVEI